MLGKLRYTLAGKPRFCPKCGEPIVRSVMEVGFDKDTGRPNKWMVWMECARRRRHPPRVFLDHFSVSWLVTSVPRDIPGSAAPNDPPGVEF
jgi:hypothetical protein